MGEYMGKGRMKMKAVVTLVLVAVVASAGVNAQSVGVSRGVTRGSPVARVSSSARATTSRGSTSRTSTGGVARSTATAPPSVKRYEAPEDVFESDDDYFSVSTQRLFDVDGYDDGEGNECFVDDEGADYFPGDDDFEDPGDAAVRGQWVKCLPPVFSVIGQARQGGKNLYPLLQDLYAALREIHNELATHIYVDIGIESDDDGEENSEMLEILNEAVLKVGRFSDPAVQGNFLSKIIGDTRRYLNFLITNRYTALETPYELGHVFSEEEDDEVPNYLKKTIRFAVSETQPTRTVRGVDIPNVVIEEINTEIEETEASNLDELEGFNVCGSDADGFETGGACMWVIDQTKYDALPDDQRDGFHNTQINDDVDGLFEGGSLRRKYFTGEDADFRLRILGATRKRRINNEDGFYVHTHMAYDNDAFLRVYTYQHVAERNYPGQIQKVCFCDWRLLTQVAEQTDCTLTYENNNGCQFEDGDNDDD